MYKIIYWRYGHKTEECYSTIEESHKHYNFISDYEIGYPECIVDESNVVVRSNNLKVRGKGDKYIED